MALTKENYDFLSKPYPADDIEFLRGFAYVRERAINIRLTEVDPAWDYRVVSYEYRNPHHVVCTVEMIVAQTVRFGVGEQKNEPNKDGIIKELDIAKGAETDAFKRAARKFGVGLYLTELPDDVRDFASYKKWYDKATGQPQSAKDRAVVGLSQVGLTLEQAIAIAKQQPPNNAFSDIEWAAWLQIVNQKRKAG